MKAYLQVLIWDIAQTQPMGTITRWTERLLNPVLGKSLVVYASKPAGKALTPMPIDVPGLVSATDLHATVDGIAEWQLPSGMIPWFPGGHADPWNHVEAAMALDLGGRRAEADRAYEWLVDLQRDDGSWHQYYVAGDDGSHPGRAGQARRQRLRLRRRRRVAPLAAHRRQRASSRRMWPVVERAIDFVLDLQTPRGEILWARHADGTPWSFALLTGSSSICHSLRCAIAIAELLGHERPDWELSAARLAHVIRDVPEAFAPKHRWAMDWYYPVLGGVVLGDAGRARLDERRDTFLMDGRGVRCVSDRPWVTVAETCECAHGPPRRRRPPARPRRCSAGPSSSATTTTAATGPAPSSPTRPASPAGERSTYTAASVVLAADALAGATPASALFVDHDAVLPSLISL